MTAPVSREEINAFGKRIQALMLDGDDALLTEIGAVPPSVDCHLASCTARVVGRVGKEAWSFTGHAVYLEDAVCLARGKLRDARQRHAEELAKAKTEKVSA